MSTLASGVIFTPPASAEAWDALVEKLWEDGPLSRKDIKDVLVKMGLPRPEPELEIRKIPTRDWNKCALHANEKSGGKYLPEHAEWREHYGTYAYSAGYRDGKKAARE